MRVVINKQDLPPVSKDGLYTLRFRIASEDQNTMSYWTPIFNVLLPSEGNKLVKNAVTASIYSNPIGQGTPQNYNIYLSWHDPNNLGFYDIYAKWYDGTWTEWQYMDTVSSRNVAFNPPVHLSQAGYTRYALAVTRPNFNRIYNEQLALFATPPDGLSLV